MTNLFGITIAVLTSPFWLPFWLTYQFRRFISLKKAPAMLDWVKNQNILLNTALELELPPKFRYLSQRGTILALHTADERYCILIKTWITSKDNYHGTFYSNTPLSEKDACLSNVPWTECVGIKERYQCFDINGKSYDEPDFARMYVAKYHSDQLLEVNFLLS